MTKWKGISKPAIHWRGGGFFYAQRGMLAQEKAGKYTWYKLPGKNMKSFFPPSTAFHGRDCFIDKIMTRVLLMAIFPGRSVFGRMVSIPCRIRRVFFRASGCFFCFNNKPLLQDLPRIYLRNRLDFYPIIITFPTVPALFFRQIIMSIELHYSSLGNKVKKSNK